LSVFGENASTEVSVSLSAGSTAPQCGVDLTGML